MLTKKDYAAIAKVINNNYDIFIDDEHSTASNIAEDLADYFAKDNPNFDEDKFLKSCGIK